MQIRSIRAFEILDSRGIPTISTKIMLSDGSQGISEVPSGASTGTSEVLEIRDRDKNRYRGKGVLKAVDIVNNEIAPNLINQEFNTQEEFDKYLIQLDGTELKSNLGGNSILSLSIAFCKASAKSKGLELYEYFADIYTKGNYTKSFFKMPKNMILIMEGGLHGNWATDFQEFMIVPDMYRIPKIQDRIRAGAEIFHATHDILEEKGYASTVGFEGAFAPKELKSNTEAIEIILEGIQRAGYQPYIDFTIALDVAASELYNSDIDKYELKTEELILSREEWLDTQIEWFNKYPIFSIEDTFDQEDWEGWRLLNERVGNKYQIVGDDLLTTNVKRINKGIELKAMNAVLIKLNQIGSITETLEAIRLTKEHGMQAVVSHRGGETNDNIIADLVVGTDADQTKFGGPDRGERLAKYNRLLEIADQLGL